MRREKLEIKGAEYPLEIYIEARTNSRVAIGKRVISLRVPQALPREEQEKIIKGMKEWAIKKLEEKPLLLEQNKYYKEGDILTIGGEQYTLSIVFEDKKGSSASIKDNCIKLSISASLSPEGQKSHISSLLSRVMAGKKLPYLREKIKLLNERHFKQTLGRISLKNTHSRWGSCSSKNNINISTRLLFAPEDVLEYVCIHELAHLIEHNHSDRFWALVEKAMPDYQDKEKWLKKHGHSYRW